MFAQNLAFSPLRLVFDGIAAAVIIQVADGGERRLIRKTDSLNSISKSCMKFSTLVIAMPNLDVMDDDETRLHRTAAAQVFAFILQALRVRPPSALRHDEADRLGTWAVEYGDILRNIPVTERKRKEPRASPYKPQRWKAFKRSP